MRRLFLSLLAIFISITFVNAGKVTVQQALQKAQQFMKGKVLSVVNTKPQSRSGNSDDADPFYIFNADDNGGFVIVSGDDRTESILGYSSAGHVDLSNAPENFMYWLQCYADQLNSLTDDYRPAASRGTRSEMTAIDPLIETTWDQDAPYNLMCPIDDGENCVTGCVATALAQVMYYHQWPKTCPAIPGYITYSNKIFMDELPSTSFKWSQMKTSYDYNETGAAADAVAELMRYCGQAMQMDYTRYSSATYLDVNRLISLFDYSKNSEMMYRDCFTNAQWDNMIYEELKNHRPVLYSGASMSSGHEFICDGYDGNGLFHLNWGWGGYCDGFFVLSLANPYGKGIGGGSGSDGFTFDQDALIGFMPSSENEQLIPSMWGDGVNVGASEYTRAAVEQDFENVQLTGIISAYYNVSPVSEQTVETGWGVYKKDKLIKCIGYGTKTIPVGKYSYDIDNDMTLSFGADIEDGKYQVYQIYRMQGETDWHICYNTVYEGLVAEINGTNLNVRKNANQFVIDGVTYSEDIEVDSPVEVTVDLTNKGETSQQMLYFWTQENEVWIRQTIGVAYLDTDESGPVVMTYTPTVSGTYDVKITFDYEGNDVMTTGSITIAEVEQVTIDGLTYSLNLLSKKARVTKADDGVLGETVIIPSTIPYNEDEYSVTAIGDGAFFYSPVVTNLVISEGVRTIGEGAFRYCFDLETVELPSTLTQIEDRAFGDCDNLSTVTARMETPFAISDNVFGISEWNSDYAALIILPPVATLYVPVGSKEKYEQADGWKEFTHIVEMGESVAITIGGKGKATFTGMVSLDFGYSDKVKAYVATGIDKESGTIWLTRVKDVPAGVPVMIKGEANKTYNVPVKEGKNSCYENMFVGNTSGESITIAETSDDGTKTNYYMSGGQFVSVKTSAKIGDGKCYLQLPTTLPAAAPGANQPVTIAATGKSSYAAPVDLDFTNVEGLKAYTATGYDRSSKTIWLTRVMKAQKGEGLLLKGDANQTYNIPSAGVQSGYGNMFVGNTSGESITIYETADDGSLMNFYLSKGVFVSVNGNATIGNNKCYLQLPTEMVSAGASTRGVEFDYNLEEPEVISMPIVIKSLTDADGTTGIDEVIKYESQSDDAFYNLQGQRVDNPGKGLYIRNGKKVVIK